MTTNPIIIRPWGSFTTLTILPNCKVKKIEVSPNQRLSLQSHNYRDEHWVITNGIGIVQNGNYHIHVKENDYVFIPRETKHRITNCSETNCLQLIETQYGSYLEEDDIIRYEDDYGRK